MVTIHMLGVIMNMKMLRRRAAERRQNGETYLDGDGPKHYEDCTRYCADCASAAGIAAETSHGGLRTPSAAWNDAGRTGRVLGGRFAAPFAATRGAAPGSWTPQRLGDGNRAAIPANNADQERGVDVCQRGYQSGARMGGCNWQSER